MILHHLFKRKKSKICKYEPHNSFKDKVSFSTKVCLQKDAPAKFAHDDNRLQR